MTDSSAVRPASVPSRLLPTGGDVQLELDDTTAFAFEVEADVDDLVRATAEQRGGDAEVRLFAPDGVLLMAMDSPTGTQGEETVSAVAAVAGRYRVEVHLSDPESPGPVILHLLQPRPASAEDRRHVEAELAFADGDHERRRGNPEEARRHYRRARELFAGTADRRYEVLAGYRVGWMGVEAGDPAAAEDLEGSVDGFAALGDGLMQARALGRLGEHYLHQGRYEEAVAVLVQARVLARSDGDLAIRAGTLARLGDVQRRLRNYDEARSAYLEALDLWQQLGDAEFELNTWLRLAALYVTVPSVSEARSCLDRAGELVERLDAPESEAVFLRDLGNFHLRTDDAAAGLEELKRSLEIRRREQMSITQQAVVLLDLGEAYLALDERDRATQVLDEALDLYRGAHDRAGEANALIKIGRLASEAAAWSQAEENLRRAADLMDELGDLQGAVTARYNLALALHRQGEYRKAHELLRPLQVEAEKLRSRPAATELRTAYLDFRYHYGELYIENLMRLHEQEPGSGWQAEGLAAADRWRARSLLDLLSPAGPPADAELVLREQRTIEEINDLERQRAGLLGSDDAEARKSVDRKLEDRVRELRSVTAQSRRETAAGGGGATLRLQREGGGNVVSDIQTRFLAPRTVLLAYALGTERSYLWVVTPRQVTSRELPAKSEIERLVQPALHLLRSPLKEDARRRADALAEVSEVVLDPAWTALRDLGINAADPAVLGRVVVVPDGVLHYLPFAALPAPAGAPAPPLIRHCEVVNLPSLSIGLALRRRPPRPRAVGVLAALADPVFSADDPRLRGAGEAGAEQRPSTTLSRAARDVDLDLYGRLPATAREARRIAADLPQARTLLAFGFDARRELVLSGRLQDYRILHFATHGLLDRSHPELSGLLLSRFDAAGRPVDGYVRLADIHRLRLRADLAVLSACETGLGREYRGEGLLSLAHGFMEAGVPRLVVSMWRVGDEDTAQLMERFYERLIGTSYRSVPDALRQAQMWMLDHEEWSSPHQWAGFIFLGDPRAVALDDSIEKAETAGGGGTPDEPPDDPTPGGGHGPGIPDGPAYWNPETTMDTAG